MDQDCVDNDLEEPWLEFCKIVWQLITVRVNSIEHSTTIMIDNAMSGLLRYTSAFSQMHLNFGLNF